MSKTTYSSPRVLVTEHFDEDVITTSAGDNYYKWDWSNDAQAQEADFQ